jgi:hypothetical protein
MMDFITAITATRAVHDNVHGENDQRRNKSTAGSTSHSWSCSVLADDNVIHGG